MTKDITEDKAANLTTSDTATLDAARQSSDILATAAPHKPKRTLGLRIFDATFYGGVVNTAILLASAASTYWTYHGNTVGNPGGALRWVGEQFFKRRKPIENALEKVGIKGEAAKIGTTVFWSFADGTVFTPLIKIIEDRREKIALYIDTVLGTKADNMRAYDAEPKQGWKSILMGRAETLGIVLPVAIIMEKTGGNKRVFYDAGDKIMSAITNHMPTLDKKMTQLVSAPHAPQYAAELGARKKSLFHVLTFEGFYTSICTVGTYLFSRLFARNHPKPEKGIPAISPSTSDTLPTNTATKHQEAGIEKESKEPKEATTPPTKISHPTHLSRLAAPVQTPELTA